MVGLVLSEHPARVTPAAVRDKAVPLPVAAELKTNDVPFVTDATVVPAAMFVPLMLMPTTSPVVLAQVTAVVPLVVQLVSTMAAV